MTKCPCGSNQSYEQCCQAYHDGKKPENALILMKARYSAYVLNNPDFIIKTTHPANPQFKNNLPEWKKGITAFSTHSTFHKLDVLDFKEKEQTAIVCFTAYITKDGQDATFTEKSFFEKINDMWMYKGGQLAQGHAPNLITTGQLKILPIAYYGNPILRKKAEPITEITSEICTLVEEMIETMDASDGIGLAAPQIHHSIRLFIIRKPSENDQGGLEVGDVKVFINPKLLNPSKETWSVNEGCLSIPALRAAVERPKEIDVEFQGLDGIVHKERFCGWEARVIMHENDHINGVLFIDRLDPKEKENIAAKLNQIEKNMRFRTF